jgi:hypothetical protein
VRQRTDMGIDEVRERRGEWNVGIKRDPESKQDPPPLPSALSGRVHVTLRDAPILNDAMTAHRVTRILTPPPSVHLAVDKGKLILAGEAPDAWQSRARIEAPLIPGVAMVDMAALASYEQHRFKTLIDEVSHPPTLAGRREVMDYFRTKIPAFAELHRIAKQLEYDYYLCLTVQGTEGAMAQLVREARVISGLMEWALHEHGVIAIWPVRIVKSIRSQSSGPGGMGISVVASSTDRWISPPAALERTTLSEAQPQ